MLGGRLSLDMELLKDSQLAENGTHRIRRHGAHAHPLKGALGIHLGLLWQVAFLAEDEAELWTLRR